MCFNRIPNKQKIKDLIIAIQEQRTRVRVLTLQNNNAKKPNKDGWVQVSRILKKNLEYEQFKLNAMYKTLHKLQNGPKSRVFGLCQCYYCTTMSDANYSKLALMVLEHINDEDFDDEYYVDVSRKKTKYIFSLFEVIYPHSSEQQQNEFMKFMKSWTNLRFAKMWHPEHYRKDMTEFLLCDKCPHSQTCVCIDSYCKIYIK